MIGLTLQKLHDMNGTVEMPKYSKKFGINLHACLREINEQLLAEYNNGRVELSERKVDMCNLLISRGFYLGE